MPCFNEAGRFDPRYWAQIASIEGLRLLFVDDGSTDTTSDVLEEFTRLRDSTSSLKLPKNLGKAEAIRIGLSENPEGFIPKGLGYLDADAAFAVVDVQRILHEFQERALRQSVVQAVWASRVMLAGRNIDRKYIRHYLSRILLTTVFWFRKCQIYDPQCGFKLFRNNSTMTLLLSQPFKTRWFVDLEIYFRWNRLSAYPLQVWEEPLLEWREVHGSKLRGLQILRVFLDIFRILKDN